MEIQNVEWKNAILIFRICMKFIQPWKCLLGDDFECENLEHFFPLDILFSSILIEAFFQQVQYVFQILIIVFFRSLFGWWEMYLKDEN